LAEPSGTVSEFVYKFDPVYTGISSRFFRRHGIKIKNYIESVTSLGKHLEQGFVFVPWSARDFEAAVKEAGFENDQREMHLGFIPSVGKIAALATHGEGYRERGSPSLHCAIAPDLCNVHLDNVGFRMDGYGPDSGLHIVDELVWQDKIVPLLGKILPSGVTELLHRLHPVVPNSRQVVPFSGVGVEVDIAGGRSKDLQRHWRVTIDLTHSCANATCDVWRKIQGQSLQGDNKIMVMFKVVGM
jgi:hypothetical protein